MQNLTYKEFGALCKMSTSAISVYAKSGKISVEVKSVDIDLAINALFISNRGVPIIKSIPKNYYQLDKEKYKKRQKAWVLSNKDKVKEYSKKQQKRDKENYIKKTLFTCGRCSEVKDISCFIAKKPKNGSICTCCKEKDKKQDEENKRLKANKVKKVKTKEQLAKYRRNRVLSGARAKDEQKRREDPIYKFKANSRTLIHMSFRKNGFIKSHKTESIIGCSLDFFKQYIESKFSEGMSFDNYGKYGWHIDHKIPLATATTKEDVTRLCHYTNMQPMWATENLRKGAKVL